MLSWTNNFITNSSKRSFILEIGNENILLSSTEKIFKVCSWEREHAS